MRWGGCPAEPVLGDCYPFLDKDSGGLGSGANGNTFDFADYFAIETYVRDIQRVAWDE